MAAVLFLFHNTVPGVIYGNGWYYFRWLSSVPLYAVGFFVGSIACLFYWGQMEVKICDSVNMDYSRER